MQKNINCTMISASLIRLLLPNLRAGDGLPDKFGLAHAIGGQPLHEVGVFFLGDKGLDDAGAVGRVVAFGQ